MARRRILVTLESRATYGYARNVMLAMRDVPELEPVTLVTGMHLMPELGNSIDLIRADGFPVSATVPMAPAGEARSAWSKALGSAIAGYADAYEELAPDVVLLSGDRAETLGCCVAAAYMGLPIAHIQAGDRSGHIDDAARYAIGKLAHIHFASCEDSAERLRRMGEQEFRLFNVGAPQLDDIVGQDYRAGSVVLDGRGIDLNGDYLLVVQHPVMVDRDEATAQMRATLDACLDSGARVIWIAPNSDLGFQGILALMREFDADDRVAVLRNVERHDYFRLLANAAALVGNSSSGILEAPSFRVPVVNIGERQRGRPQASNIFDCPHDRAAIAATIRRVLTDAGAKAAVARAENPYGDGRSGPRICEILRDIPLDRRLLDKQGTY
ncbi:MAG: UDP-N-acetylglucosamine 2-epimerase [Acetobacterales bacterium]